MQPLNSCELVLNVTYSLALKSYPSYPEWMPWLRSGCPVGQLSRALVGSPKGARGVGLRKPRSLLLPLVINFSEALCPLPYTPIHLNDLSDCTKTASHKKNAVHCWQVLSQTCPRCRYISRTASRWRCYGNFWLLFCKFWLNHNCVFWGSSLVWFIVANVAQCFARLKMRRCSTSSVIGGAASVSWFDSGGADGTSWHKVVIGNTSLAWA